MTQCAKIIIVGFMANVGNVFLSNVYKRFFNFLHVSAFFLTFFGCHLNVYYIHGINRVINNKCT